MRNRKSIYTLFLFSFALTFTSENLLAQANPFSNQNTSNLAVPTNQAHQFLEGQLVIFGVETLLYGGSLWIFRNPEYITADRTYKQNRRIYERRAEKVAKLKGRVEQDQLRIKELNNSHQALQTEFEKLGKQIEEQRARLEEAKKYPLAAEKNEKLLELNAEMNRHRALAANLHRGPNLTDAEFLESLPAKERADYERAKILYNKLYHLDDLSQAEKADRIKEAEKLLESEIKSRDFIGTQIQENRKAVDSLTVEIQKISPEILNAQNLAEEAQTSMRASAAIKKEIEDKWGWKKAPYRILEYVGGAYLLADLATRTTQYVFLEKDPGGFPVFRMFFRPSVARE